MRRILRAAALAAVAAIALAPAVARADDASTVTVVGTSDVSDSGLVDNVLKPGFEAAFPQYHLSYVPLGTGAAINFARAGTASALLVHAASLENQFVADGYSNEQYGRALFYGDYILLAPADDPAGVAASAPHDIVTAFERIAAAGANGQANFVSRGGSPPPGTGVEEHLIWARTTSGIQTCKVSDANGGGTKPTTAAAGSDCPAGNNASTPTWYHETGSNQGATMDNADVCNYGTATGQCYVLTDRGTFQFKQSRTPPTATHLHIVTRDNAASARGGQNFLINSFHGYVLNPSKFAGSPNVAINVAGATAFLNWVTSPAGQAASQAFLNGGGDPPFKGSAAPALTGSSVPATVNAGRAVTVTGNLHNVVPGTPSLAGETVNLQTPAGKLASAVADASGTYSITYTPTASGAFSVSTGQITKVEDATLHPIFGDLLNATSASVGSLTVQSSINVDKVTTDYRSATVSGSVLPATGHKAAVVSILARKKGSKGAFASYAKAALTGGTYSIPVKLSPAAWEFQARFDDPGQVISSVATTTSATVPGASTVKFTKASLKGRNLTVAGRLTPAPSITGAYVRLLGRRSGKGKFSSIGRRVDIVKGRKTFTIRTHLTRHTTYRLRLEYVHKGHIDTSASVTRKVTVH